VGTLEHALRDDWGLPIEFAIGRQDRPVWTVDDEEWCEARRQIDGRARDDAGRRYTGVELPCSVLGQLLLGIIRAAPEILLDDHEDQPEQAGRQHSQW
jgi:hypothetical protein